jgi:hypothetical protein
MEIMLNDLIEIVKQWPAIIQGALGSGLFWLTLNLAQKVFKWSSLHFSKYSKSQRISWLISREAKHGAFGGAIDNSEAAYCTSVLIYRSLRFVYMGFLWLGLGLVISPFIESGLVIGGMGLIYFFLKAYEVVSPISADENTPEAWQETKQELIDLDVLPELRPDEETNNGK